MVRDYELMYIVRPDVDDEGLTAATESVAAIIAGQGGEVVTTTPWGKRRLAYEIDRLRDGHYVLLHIRLDGDRVRELERLLSIHDTVFRHLLTLYVEERPRDGEAPAEGGRPAGRTRGERDGRVEGVDDEEAVAVARGRRTEDEEVEPDVDDPGAGGEEDE